MLLDTRNFRDSNPLPRQRQVKRPSCFSTDDRQFDVSWADCEDDVRDAQRLRYQVFAQEMGAHLTPPVGTPAGLDADRFDAYCDHVLVRLPTLPGAAPGMLVGTYRVLAPGAARRAGGLYIDTEFDLAPLRRLRAHAVELGRSCVHADWRSGGVILALWTALGRYMQTFRLKTMMGCASVQLDDGGQTADRLWQRLRHTHLVDRKWQVLPYHGLVLPADLTTAESQATTPYANAPPLIKGYLRCGARLLGPPAVDVAFNTADLPLMLRVDELAPRYRSHFLGY